MFDIRVLPASRLGPENERLGEITIGDFSERFACHPYSRRVDEFEAAWCEELDRLVRGAPFVVLVHDPRFAWIVYRDGSRCYIQQRFSLDGRFDDIAPRCTHTEDGEKISEWETTITEFERFLDSRRQTT